MQSPHCEEFFSKQAGLHYQVQDDHPDESRKEQAPTFVSLRQTAILYFGALNRVAEVV